MASQTSHVVNFTIIAISRIGQYLSYSIQTWHDGRLMQGLYAHVDVDDLDLDARLQWLGRGNKFSVELSRQLSKQ